MKLSTLDTGVVTLFVLEAMIERP